MVSNFQEVDPPIKTWRKLEGMVTFDEGVVAKLILDMNLGSQPCAFRVRIAGNQFIADEPSNLSCNRPSKWSLRSNSTDPKKVTADGAKVAAEAAAKAKAAEAEAALQSAMQAGDATALGTAIAEADKVMPPPPSLDAAKARLGELEAAAVVAAAKAKAAEAEAALQSAMQIGRASCRERV